MSGAADLDTPTLEPEAWRMLVFLEWMWSAYAREGRRFGVEFRRDLDRYEALALAGAADARLASEWRAHAAFLRLALGLFAGARAAVIYQTGARP